MRVKTSILLSVLLAAYCGSLSFVFAQSALERLERQIRQRAGATDANRSGATKPIPPPPAPAPQAAGAPRGATDLGVVADDQKDRGRGVRILDVRRGSPAEKAGLRQQDLIVAIAGTRVRQMTDMDDIVDSFAPGQSVDFELLRGADRAKVRVTLGQRQAAVGQPSGPPEIIPPPPAESPPVRPEPAAGPSLLPPPSVPSPAEASRLERLERRIEQLERRVAELERQLAEARKKP
jgi:hypothetical protein